MTELAIEIIVPATVIAEPPTASVSLPIKYNPVAIGLIVEPATVISSCGEISIDCDAERGDRPWEGVAISVVVSTLPRILVI
jgi:hypothetical protein